MGSFVVSALKYRPATFKSVVGQSALTTTLKNAIKSNKLAHSYLFCGPRGVGKTTCARIFAKTINCDNRTPEGEACNQCESCVSFNQQRSYSIHELDAASNNGVDDIRSLTDQVRIPPQVGRYSVYIIDEVHMLSQGAFNAFLKTLEEPPAHAIFILATTEKHKIIPTILSRCQIYDFNRISITDTVNHLKYVANAEGIQIEESALNIIAQKSDGGMRDALSTFDQLVSFTGNNITYQATIENLNVLDYYYYYRIVNAFLSGGVSESLLLFNEILNKGFDAHHFIGGLSSYLRDLLVSKDPATIKLLEVGAEIAERYKQQASVCDTGFIFNALKISNDCDLNYRISKNKRLLVELALIKICQLGGDKKKNLIETDDIPKLQKISTEPTTANGGAQVNVTSQPETQYVSGSIAGSQQTNLNSSNNPAHEQQASANNVSPKFNRPKSISINTSRQIEAEAESDTFQNKITSNDQTITQVELEKKWLIYSEQKTNNPATEAFLKMHLPTLKEATAIEVTVDNVFQEKELQQMDIMQYLRSELQNSRLTLNIKFTPEEEIQKRLTPQELYRKMASENPNIEIMRKNLAMEID